MLPELFHYVHCPYCVRVRLALGYLGLDWKSTVLPYNDEATPLKLAGKKMLPIMVIDGVATNESLDIIRKLDLSNRLQHQIVSTAQWHQFEELVNQLGKNVHNMAMPYWVWGPEFDDLSRAYFIDKKSAKRGPFDQLRSRREEFEQPLLKDLERLSVNLNPYWESAQFSIRDIVLAAQLWGLYVVPEFRFPQPWHDYLMRVKKIARFEYHAHYWRTA